MARRYVFDDDLPDDPPPAPAAQPTGGNQALRDAVAFTGEPGLVARFGPLAAVGENVLGPIYSKAQRDFMEAFESMDRYRVAPASVPRQPAPDPGIVPTLDDLGRLEQARQREWEARRDYEAAERADLPINARFALNEAWWKARQDLALAERLCGIENRRAIRQGLRARIEPPGIDPDQPPGAVRTMLEQLRDAQETLARDREDLAWRARPSEYSRIRTSNTTSDF